MIDEKNLPVIVTPLDVAPCRVFDANGLEWDYVVEVNRETGEITQLKRSKDGRGFELDPVTLDIIRVTTKTAVPIHFDHVH